jgi:hypothetical protein
MIRGRQLIAVASVPLRFFERLSVENHVRQGSDGVEERLREAGKWRDEWEIEGILCM